MQKKRGRKSKRPPKEIFETLYYNNYVTAKQLAKEYKVKEQTIYNWANEYKKEKTNGNKRNERN